MTPPLSMFSRRSALKTIGAGVLSLPVWSGAAWGQTKGGVSLERANEVMAYLQEHFWDGKLDLYRAKADAGDPDFIWGGGVMFSALVGASRHDKRYRGIMRKFFNALEGYWDDKVKVPGYEPARTGGGGSDKYYDDNAWMVITYLEAYEVTGETRYLKKAAATLEFVMSGWDEELGGGIWWHEGHKGGGKNTCANAPAAVGCLRLAKFRSGKEAAALVEDGKKVVEWTKKTLGAPNGLYADAINVETKEINHAQLTYNAGLMLRAFLGLHAHTGKKEYLDEAKRIGEAADSLLQQETGVYRDPMKWAHLMVEADFELHRWTQKSRFLKRARTNCEGHYERWKEKKPDELIENASLARELWLLVDSETDVGRKFWKESDRVK